MRSRLTPHALIAVIAAIAALFLTIVRPSPSGLVSFGIGDREVRAAPGAPAVQASQHNLTALKIFNLTLVRIRDSYVDPARIEPKKMLYAALDSVQFHVPEVLIEPYPERDEVVVVVNDKKQTFSAKEVDSPWRLSSKLKKIFRFIESNVNSGADLARVEYAAVNGMLETLDPHSVLLDPETARDMEVSTSGKFGGLGIVIRMFERKLTIVRPIKGTPASRAGLRRGDRIIKIDDEVTENLTLNEAVERMRGDPSTKITLFIERPGEKTLRRVELMRDLIRVESVDYKLLDKKVGLIRIKQFSGNTAQEVREAMDSLEQKGARAWVLDLRWNPGGLLEQAIKVSDLFVDQGTIVTTVGGREREPRRANRRGTDDKAPVAVLVNSASASASEIVAGALKNLDRAVIIGNSTFGKGSVQVLYDNADGSKLKLTIAQYLTPGDKSIQSVGITPDIELHRMVVAKASGDRDEVIRLLKSEKSYKEKDLASHLISSYAQKPEEASYQLGFLWEPPAQKDPLDGAFADEEPLDEDIVEDFEMRLARDLVATAAAKDRTNLVKAARGLVAKRQVQEHERLAKALLALGVDWTEPASKPAPAELVARMAIEPGSTIKAGDEVRLVGTVENVGSTAAHQVHARVQADDYVFDESELIFGKIEPGQKKTWVTHVKVPEDAIDRVDHLGFAVRDASGAQTSVAPVKVRVVAAQRPVFAYTHQLIDKGNGDGLVQKNEAHGIRVTVRNIGDGVAKEPTALLRNASGDGVRLRKARFELGKLAPGESKTVEFEFDVLPALREDELVVEMTVYDAVLHESTGEKLRYRVMPAGTPVTPVKGWVRVKSSTDIREGAAEQAGAIARAGQGASFAVTGRLGEWTRVVLDGGRAGFIESAKLESVAAGGKRAAVRPIWQVTPPTLAVEVPHLETTSDQYRLRGRATDDTHVEDVYIFVSNSDAKVDNKKVFYKSNRGGKSESALTFDATLPLYPGSNQITIVARENDDVRTAESLVIYRESGPTTAGTSRPKR